MITVRNDPSFDIEGLVVRWDGTADLAGYGVGFLFGACRRVVDGHFAAVQQLDEALEGLEDLLFDERPHSAEVQRRSFELRKSLVVLRRLALPMREVVNSLLRRDLGLVDEAMGPYFQDVYDHVLRATEWTESLRDLVSTILETNLTIQDNRQNAIMKKVTSWAAIIAVPTAVTGYYGMNVPYPGFGRPSGAVASTVLIVTLVRWPVPALQTPGLALTCQSATCCQRVMESRRAARTIRRGRDDRRLSLGRQVTLPASRSVWTLLLVKWPWGGAGAGSMSVGAAIRRQGS